MAAERRLTTNMTAPPTAATAKATSTIQTVPDPEEDDGGGDDVAPDANAIFASEVSVDPSPAVVEVTGSAPGSMAITEPLVWANTLVDGDGLLGSLGTNVVVDLLPEGTVVVGAPG